MTKRKSQVLAMGLLAPLIAATMALAAALSLAVLAAPIGAAAAGLGTAAALFAAIIPLTRRKLALLVGMVLALIAAVPLAATDVTTALRAIGDRALAHGPQSVTYPERLALWTISAAFPLGGLVAGAPHSALAQLRVLVPGDARVVVESDFPMRSGKIRRFVEASGTGSARTQLWWSSYYEEPAHDVALLFNGGELVIERGDGSCRAEASNMASYKPQHRSSTLIALGPIRFAVDQAAFWAMQELGWLFPYELVYRWEC